MANALNKPKVAVLRQMCIDNGIELDDAVKYAKAQLITLMTSVELSDNDQIQSDKGEELGDSSEAELPVKTTSSKEEVKGEDSDSEISYSEFELKTVSALKLKLKIVKASLKTQTTKLEIKSERISAGKQLHDATDSIIMRELRGILPTMSNDTDILSFFFTFEKALQLYSVDESLCAKILLSLLNSKCQKVYAKLTVAACGDYTVVKKLF